MAGNALMIPEMQALTYALRAYVTELAGQLELVLPGAIDRAEAGALATIDRVLVHDADIRRMTAETLNHLALHSKAAAKGRPDPKG